MKSLNEINWSQAFNFVFQNVELVMLKIAHNISNLSDARYFAAAGFDWILFNFGPGSLEHKHHIFGISEWISGSKTGIVVHDHEELNYFLAYHPELKGFWINNHIGPMPLLDASFSIFNNSEHDYPEVFKIIQTPIVKESIENLILDLTHLNPDGIELPELSISGICLSGTEEESPGLKSYHQMEKWMDILEEL